MAAKASLGCTMTHVSTTAQWGMIRKSVGQGMMANRHDIGFEARIPFTLYDFRFYSKFDAASLL